MTKIDFRACDKFIATAIACAALIAASSARAEAVNRCARLGADYVAVSGSNGCVRLGGHVRVDLRRNLEPATVTPNVAPNLSPMGYAAPDGVLAAAARIAHQPMSPFDLFPR